MRLAHNLGSAGLLLLAGFVTSESSLRAQGTPAAGKAIAVDSAYLEALVRGQRRWFTGQYLAKSFGVLIHNVTGQECLRRLVRFTPLTSSVASGADVKAFEVRGQWNGRACAASLRWRLSEVPGEQRLQARLLRAESDSVPNTFLDKTTADFTATAHAPGSLFIGGVWVPGGIGGVTGASPEDVEKKERSFQPIVGIDLPVLLSVFPRPSFLDNVRGVLATSLRDIGSDLYVGIELFPLINGARGGGFPLQASIGSRIGFKSHGDIFFFAMHYNASGALSTALGLLK